MRTFDPPARLQVEVRALPVVLLVIGVTLFLAAPGAARGQPRPAATEHFDHARTRYPLVGQHARVACDRCHSPARPEATRFRGLDFAHCTSCHADRHAGEFATRQGGDCAPCHSVDGFRPTRFGVEAHATTQYPLAGKHQAIPCSACHARPRPRLDLHLAGRACADCHPDPHAGEFTAEMQRGGCAECHDESDWNQLRIEHSTWPLTGAHARTGCVPCHGKIEGQGQTPAERARYRGIPRDCEGCHTDAHAGQFRLNEPVRACSSCHGTESWKRDTGYDHGRQAGWPLAGQHARLACAACHPSVRLRDGSTAVRYRLGYRACRACHADPHTEGP